MTIRHMVGMLVLGPFLFWSAYPSMAELPPLFEGEIGVCNAVERSRVQGETLENSLRTLMDDMRTNDPEVHSSIMRTIIHIAIRVCNYDPSTVITVAFQAELPLDLIIGAAMGAQVNQAVIVKTLVDLGVQPEVIASVMDQLRAPALADFFLPPPFTAGIELGQGSPFAP